MVCEYLVDVALCYCTSWCQQMIYFVGVNFCKWFLLFIKGYCFFCAIIYIFLFLKLTPMLHTPAINLITLCICDCVMFFSKMDHLWNDYILYSRVFWQLNSTKRYTLNFPGLDQNTKLEGTGLPGQEPILRRVNEQIIEILWKLFWLWHWF